MADCEKQMGRKNVSNKKAIPQENCELQKPVRYECEIVGDRPRSSQLGSERCLLCDCEQFDSFRHDNLDKPQSSSSATILPKVPLWVCPSCRKYVEEQERKAALEPGSPCESGHLERDQHQFQLLWSEVCNFVRCVYREAGTSLADGEETMKNTLDEERFKSKVDRLLSIDPQQIFDKLECQAREYVKEVKSRLTSFLDSCPLTPQHAREFFSMFLDEYQALCQAADTLRPFFVKLENPILKCFNLSWTSLHKHLFYNEIFRDPVIHDRLQAVGSQLSLGASSQDAYSNLLQRYLVFTREMNPTDSRWRDLSDKNLTKLCHNRFKCDSHAADLPSGLLSCDDLRPASLMMNELNLRNCSCFDKACALATTNHKQDQSSECRCSKCSYHNSKLDVGLGCKDVTHAHHPPKVCSNGHPSPQLDPHHHHDNSTLHGKCTTDTCRHGNPRSDSGGTRGSGKGIGGASSAQSGTCAPELNGVLDSGSNNSTRKGSVDDSTQISGSTAEDGRSGTGKYCDCCYCEFFGHAAPPVAPTSHNYTEMRDKLRQKLTKKTPRADSSKASRPAVPVVDHRSVDDLLSFINGPCDRLNGEADTNSKKRSRQRQKKASVQEKQNQAQAPPPAKIEPGDDKSKESENKRKNQYNKQRSGDKTPERDQRSGKAQSMPTSGKTNASPASHETQPAKKAPEKVEPSAGTAPAPGQKKSKGRKKYKASLDDVFLPRNDFEHGDTIHDEAERELEEFKRFCMTPVERRERIPVNVNIKTLTKRACFS